MIGVKNEAEITWICTPLFRPEIEVNSSDCACFCYQGHIPLKLATHCAQTRVSVEHGCLWEEKNNIRNVRSGQQSLQRSRSEVVKTCRVQGMPPAIRYWEDVLREEIMVVTPHTRTSPKGIMHCMYCSIIAHCNNRAAPSLHVYLRGSPGSGPPPLWTFNVSVTIQGTFESTIYILLIPSNFLLYYY